MTHQGVILYGGPASGKDTVTEELSGLDPQFRLFRRLKAGPGRTAGYRLTSHDEIDELRKNDQIIWENTRYSSTYVIDQPELDRMLKASQIPVLHLGQPEAIAAVRSATPTTRWNTVELWCPLDVATARIVGRATGDSTERLRAWSETPHLASPDLFIDTSRTGPVEAAQIVANAARA